MRNVLVYEHAHALQAVEDHGLENLFQRRDKIKTLGNHEKIWKRSELLARVMYRGGLVLIVSFATFSAKTSVGIAFVADLAIFNLLRI